MTGNKTPADLAQGQAASNTPFPDVRTSAGTPMAKGTVRKGRLVFWFLVLLALLLGMALGALGARYVLKDSAARAYDALQQQLTSELLVARMDLAKAQAHADALSGSLLVEEGTRKGVEASLETVQAELGNTRERLAFFDQLFPPGPQGAVSIRALTAERRGDHLAYRALFMRNALNAPKFEGNMQFVATGLQDGKSVSVVLEPVHGKSEPDAPASEPSSAGGKSPVAAKNTAGSSGAAAGKEKDKGSFLLQFDEFQRSAGMLQLPEGFSPTKLTLNVLEGDAVRAARTISIDTDE